MNLPILVTLVLYKILLVVIGVLNARNTRTEEDFFLGGRRLGPLVTAISSAASSSSAWTLLGVSGAAWRWGLGAGWLLVGCVGGFALNWFLLAPRLQRLSRERGALTVLDLLADRDGGRGEALVRRALVILVLLSLMTYVASQFGGASKTFELAFGLHRTPSVLIGAGIIVLYTLLGGFWAVSVTDTLQGLVMAATAVILPAGALLACAARPDAWQTFTEIPVEGWMIPMRHAAAPAAIGFVLGLLGIGLGYPGQPHVVNRFMALREDGGRSLRRARTFAMAWALCVYTGMILLGWAGRVLAPQTGDSEKLLMGLATQLFHPVVAGVMLAAVLSAIMSTADSQLLVAGSCITRDWDVEGRLGARRLLVSRITVGVLSAAACVVALTVPARIYDQTLFAWTAMGVVLGPLLLVRVWKGSCPWRVRLTVVLLGAGGTIASMHWLPGAAWRGLERVGLFAVLLALAWFTARPEESDARGRNPSIR